MEQFRNRIRIRATLVVCLLLVLAAVIVSLYEQRRELCYCIHGFTTSGHEAIWYTSSYEVSGDTIYYFNIDGSRVDIMAPYTLVDNCED
jgi:hypothetical protein